MTPFVQQERQKFEENYKNIEKRLVRLEEATPPPNILRFSPRKEVLNEKPKE